MKKLLLSTSGLFALALSSPAFAADLSAPVYKGPPAMIPAVYDWGGFYFGANGGWGNQHRCFDATDPTGVFVAAEGCHDASGAVAGGQVGYRWQSSGWVFGLEFQGDWTGLSGSNASQAFPGFTNKSRLNAFGLLTGQVGYSWNNALLYVKGGAAFTNNSEQILVTATSTVVGVSTTDVRWGATAGAGFEYAFTPNWSAAVEYDHLFVSNRLTNFTTPGGSFFGTDNIRGDADLVTVRLNYRWGGPVIAKY